MKNLFIFIFSIISCNLFALESRDRVVIIDTGISKEFYGTNLNKMCTDGHMSMIKAEPYIWDRHGHGTNIASIILKAISPSIQCVVIVKYTSVGVNDLEAADYTAKALLYVRNLKKVKYINYSSSGDGTSVVEKSQLLFLLNNGVKISVAAGNNRTNLSLKCFAYPACYGLKSRNLAIVGAYAVEETNFGGPITDYEWGCGGQPRMCGTSQATAFHTVKLIEADLRNAHNGY